MPKKITNAEFQAIILRKFDGKIKCLDKFISYRQSTSMRFKCRRDPRHDWVYTSSAQQILRTEGSGCPFCDRQRKTAKMVANELAAKYGKKVILKSEWTSESKTFDKMIFTCIKHGDFEENLHNLLNVYVNGCAKCSYQQLAHRKRDRVKQELIDKLKVISEGKIELVADSYVNVNTKATFKCSMHGEFSRVPGRILYQGRYKCPKCSMSNGEVHIDTLLTSLGLTYKSQCMFKSLGKLRFDFYIPSLKLAIEFDGKQHHDPRSRFYSKGLVERDRAKDEFCQRKGITLIRFRDDSRSLTVAKRKLIDETINNALREEGSTTIQIVDLTVL